MKYTQKTKTERPEKKSKLNHSVCTEKRTLECAVADRKGQMQSNLRKCWSHLSCPKSVFKFCQVWLQKVFCSPRLVSRPPCSLINGSRTEMERQMHNAVHMLHTTMQCNGYHNARCNAMDTTIPQCILRQHPFLSTMHTSMHCTPQYTP